MTPAKRKKKIEAYRKIAQQMRDTPMLFLLSELDRRDEALKKAVEECGPPKLSESVGTAFARIKAIGKIVREALGGRVKGIDAETPVPLLNLPDAEVNCTWLFKGPGRVLQYKMDRKYFDENPERGRHLVKAAFQNWLKKS